MPNNQKGREMITASVGKTGQNKSHDVALIQAALLNVKVAGKATFTGRVDGRSSPALVAAILTFQNTNRVTPANGTFQSIGPGMMKLKNSLPASLKGMRAITGTAAVYVSTASENSAKAEANAQKTKAPFPMDGPEALAKIFDKTYSTAKLSLTRMKDSITEQGHFRTQLDFVGVRWVNSGGKLMLNGQESQVATDEINRIVLKNKFWTFESKRNLIIYSKIYLNALKNRRALTDKQMAILNIPQYGIVKDLVGGLFHLLFESFYDSMGPRQKAESMEANEDYPMLCSALENYDAALLKNVIDYIDECREQRVLYSNIRLLEIRLLHHKALISTIMSGLSDKVDELSDREKLKATKSFMEAATETLELFKKKGAALSRMSNLVGIATSINDMADSYAEFRKYERLIEQEMFQLSLTRDNLEYVSRIMDKASKRLKELDSPI